MEDMEEFYGFSSISNETCQERRKLLSDLICNLENQIEESSKANGSRSVKVDIMDLKWGSEIELSEDEGSLASLIDPDELPANVDELLDSHDEDIGDEEDKYYSSDDHQECSYTGNNIVDGCQLEESSTLNIVQENKTFAQELIESLLNDVLNTFDTNTNDHNITKVTNLNTGEETTELINPSPDIPTCELENVDTSNQVSGRQLRSRHTSGVSGSSSVSSSGVVTVNRSRQSSGRSSRSRHTSGESIGTEEVVQPQDDDISLEEEPLAKRKELSARRRSNVGEVGPLELSQKSLARSKSPLTEDASVVVAVITKKKLRSKEKDGFGGQAEAEADILKRVAELQSDDLWTGKKMPKKDAEYPQGKLHWDFVLEEMIWLSKVVQQEIKTKKLIAKKCAGIIQKHFKDKELAVARAERAKEANLRKIATNMSREIKIFWGNVNKLFEYRVKIKLDMKKKEALDQHLNFIVDKTEKYSTLLAESLADTAGSGVQSRAESVGPSRAESAGPSRAESEDEDVVTDNDKEYKPSGDSDDDEETIEKDEKEVDDKSQENEINMLNDEADVPIEELLKKYYPDTFGHIEAKKDTTNSQEDEDIGRGRRRKKPMDIAQIEAQIKAEEMQIEAQLKSEETQLESPTELKENQIDAQIRSEEKQIEDEIKAEQKKIEAWIEAKEGKVDVDDMMAIDNKEVSRDEMEKAITEDDKNSETEETKKSADDKSPINDEDKLREDKLEEYASMAAKFQPTGNTLDTTTVKTKVPFLLKHTLREYQHIGLDWMVSLYERSLNGILADEMGLGKTIQTIAFMAHLATDLANWGPHLIVVPTSVMLNWEMEIKKWSPAFKVLVYYGNQKERRQKRVGWTKQNAFHICITSYKLVIQDHSSFRRFKWQYLILDEAQHIKNFKSQRWQLLLNFTSVGRLLLTGTPLQNNLMELWSLMHFLMPHVFDSHRDFKEWFSNPMSGMVEGNSEYNDSLIKRLHKVLRPFILRRLKKEVEKQMPSKYEHLVKCPLSKRQRFLYDDFMSRAAVKDTISSGNLLSVINVLMQLRKCCNHPNLFEPRSTLSPFVVESVSHRTPRMAADLLTYKPLIRIDLSTLPLIFTPLET